MKDTKTLPSIVDWLRERNLSPEKFRFVKPKVPTGLRDFNPESEYLGTYFLTLENSCATPVHVHNAKEKIYINLPFSGASGEFRLMTLEEDGLFDRSVSLCERVFVPYGVPHAVYSLTGQITVMVISAPKNADVIWEPDADQLVAKTTR